MKKTFSLIVAILFLTCALLGCTVNTENTGATGAVAIQTSEKTGQEASSEKTVITLTVSYTRPLFEAGFEAAYPNIDLQVEEMSTGTINGEVARRLRKGHGSDLIVTNLPAGEIADYAYDLSATSVVEKYQSAITSTIAVDGHNLYLPLPGTYYGYYINKTLLDEMGLALPETADDLLNILRTAKEKGIGVDANGYGFGLSDIGATFLGAYFAGDYATDFLALADGTRWLADFNNGTVGFTGYWENSVTFLKTCVDEGLINKDKLLVLYNGHIDANVNAFKAEERIAERTAIASYGNLLMYDQICANTEDEIVMLPCLPSTSDGVSLLSAVSNDYIAINKALENDETKLNAALCVLEYLSSEEGQRLWMEDTQCPHTYLNGYTANTDTLPETIRSYVENGLVFTNPFPTNLLSYIGKNLTDVAKGKTDIADALAKIDDYRVNGSDDVDYDISVVGTVSADMLYENANTRKQETEIGNFISDAIREISGADVALVNGGGIRSSLYAGDITGEDLSNTCPYGNLIIVCEMDGATLRAAITNGIQKTWKPAGQFLQVSGICYSFKPATDETQVAELITLTYADGTEVQDSDVLTVAYTNYMGGSGGYVDAGDGFTMLNVYDDTLPKTVKLIEETGKTYCDMLKAYFAAHADENLCGKLEGRIEVIQ